MVDAARILLEIAPAFMAYYLAALGHGFFEKSGVLNLAIDGVFVLCVAVSFATAVFTVNCWIGLLSAIIVGMLFGLLLAYLTTKFPISHGAAGLSIMFLGYGLAAIVGRPAREYQGATGVTGYAMPADPVSKTLMYVIPILVGIALLMLLNKTKLGAAIRAAGENPHAAAALGVDVLKVRLIAALIGYGLIGAGAAAYDLAWLPIWSEGHGLNQGWLAFAISLSAGRHPLLTIVSALIFAGLVKYQFSLLATYGLSTDTAKMVPFIAAILAMVIYSITPLRRKLAPPASLGKIYFKEEKTV